MANEYPCPVCEGETSRWFSDQSAARSTGEWCDICVYLQWIGFCDQNEPILVPRK